MKVGSFHKNNPPKSVGYQIKVLLSELFFLTLQSFGTSEKKTILTIGRELQRFRALNQLISAHSICKISIPKPHYFLLHQNDMYISHLSIQNKNAHETNFASNPISFLEYPSTS